MDRILFATPRFGRHSGGGLGTSAERIANHLSELAPLSIITPREDLAANTYQIESGGDRLEIVRVGHGREPALTWQFFSDIIDLWAGRARNPLFCGFYCTELAYVTALVARLHGRQPLLFARGNDIDLEPFGENAFKIHFALEAASKVFCVTRELERKIRAFAPRAKTKFIPNGVDPSAFAFDDGYRPSKPLRLGLFGDIKAKKGLELLLAAIDFDRFELLLAGTLRDDARRLLHGFLTLHPAAIPKIRREPFTSNADRLASLYRDVDIICLPSVHEGMSNVMLEALSMGKVCVCSNVGGAPDVIRDGENGFLFENRSPESLADALSRASSCLNSKAHEALRQAARQTIMDGFTSKKERRRYLDAIQAMSS